MAITGGTSSPILSNVTFSGNSAGEDGGAMYNEKMGVCSPQVRNSILWNNKDINGNGTITANINNHRHREIYYSLVASGGGAGWSIGPQLCERGGNIDMDPKFVTNVDPPPHQLQPEICV